MVLFAPSTGSEDDTDAPRPMTPPTGVPALGSTERPTTDANPTALYAALRATNAQVTPLDLGGILDDFDKPDEQAA